MSVDPTASQLSNSLASLVEANQRSTVAIHGRRRAPSTGVVFNEGVLVTAGHTLERDDEIPVTLADGVELSARLVGRDPSTDIAVLKIDAKGLVKPTWSGSENLKIGHLVLSLGRSHRGVTAGLGMISTLGEGWRTPAGGRIDRWIGTDLGPRPGFSGSLLLDLEGRAIGINTSSLSSLPRAVSLVIPTSTLERVVQALLSKGQVQRAFVGITSQPVRLPDKIAAKLRQESGLLVIGIQSDGPADKAGVLLGDLIYGIDQEPIGDIGDLLGFLEEERIGKESTLKIVRAGETKELKVTIGARSR
jgi:S1-C subfamily serine protease